MIYRKLGNSGIEASAIGLGAWAIGGWMWGGIEERQAIEAIQVSLENGVNLIDTAAIYGFGRSEQIVGKAIKNKRSQVVLATKCGLVWDKEKGKLHFHSDDKGITPGPSQKKVYIYLEPQSIREELEKSLSRLGTDYIDLYQTHWQEPTTPIEDTMAELMKMKDEGKIRAIGVSNTDLEQLQSYGPIDTDQERYSMLDRKMEKNGTLEYCIKNNIAVLAYSPLVHGLLTGKITPERQFKEGDLRRNNPRFSPSNRQRVQEMLGQFVPIAQSHKATVSQIVIAWTFMRRGITHVLCGARNAEQARENAGAGNISLAANELQTMDKIIGEFLPTMEGMGT